MSTASEEIRTALTAAETLPVGPERIGALDTVLTFVTRAGGVDEVGRLGTRIRSRLLTACLTGGQHRRVPELLGWLTARYDEAPGWMDEELRRQVLANLAEAAPGLLLYPDVSRSLINHIVTGAEQRYAQAGEPAGPVLRARFRFTRHVEGVLAASGVLESWLAAGPSPVGIGCPDCERAEQVRALVELGAYQRAIDHAEPVLRASSSACETQPAGMIGAVMPALLRTGLVGAAAAEHVRAVRLIQAQVAAASASAAVSASRASAGGPATGSLPATGYGPLTGQFPMIRDVLATASMPLLGDARVADEVLVAGDTLAAASIAASGAADQLLVCARTGRLRHGLDLLREWLPALSRSREPLVQLETAAAIARLVWSLTEAGRATEVVVPAARAGTLPGRPAGSADLTVSLLGEWVLSENTRLASLFDRRNESTTIGDGLREILGSAALPDLPLKAFERSGLPEWAPPSTRGRRVDDDGELADITLLAKEFEDGLRADSSEAMRAVLNAWSSLRANDADGNDSVAQAGGDVVQPGADRDLNSGTEEAAARLDGWLALDQIASHTFDPRLGPPPEAQVLADARVLMEAARAATRRMRAAGLTLEALLHDQACLLAGAQNRLLEPGPTMERIEELTAEVAGEGSGPDLGEALSRLVLAREIAVHAGVSVPAQISELVPMNGAVPDGVTALLAINPAFSADFDPAPDEMGLDDAGFAEDDGPEVQPIHDPAVAEPFGPVAMPTSLLGPFITTPIRVTPSESPGHRPFPEDDDTSRPRRRLDAMEKLRAQMSPEEVHELARTLDLVNFDPLETAVAQLRSVPPERLEHRHLRALTRMLRLRARDEPRPTAISTLMQAIATLPDGVRPLERAQAGADLATLLAETDPGAALAVWDRAVEDAETAGEGPVLGTLLAASAMLRHRTGDASRAAAGLARAVPLLDRFAPAALAGQCRVDLSRVLLELDRPFAAAAAAEAALADVVATLRADGLETPPVKRENAAPDEVEPPAGEISPEVASRLHLAGAAAFAAAEANSTAGTPGPARRLALRSAQWHARNGNPIGQAEAWQLAARVAGRPGRVAADLLRAAELAEAGGDWGRAATCRRERVTAVRADAGDEAALDALDEADETLQGWARSLSGRRVPEEEREHAEYQMRWHRVAVAEQRARLLALAGYFGEAMEVAGPLVDEYRHLGDAWSARDLQGLRGQLRAELGDLDGAVADLGEAAAAASTAGEAEQTHGLGARLAAVLGGAGRDDEAEATWTRYCEPHES